MAVMVDLVKHPAEPRSQPSRLGFMLLVASFTLGALVFAEGLRGQLPSPGGGSHLLHYRQYSERYDTLFFGSSKVEFGLDPRVFDKELAAAGVESSSFNFGLSGVNGLYIEYALKEALSYAKRPLRRVIVDVGDLGIRTRHLDDLSDQVTSRHDLMTTLRYLSLVPKMPEGGKVKWRTARNLVKAWARRQTNLGALSRWARTSFIRNKTERVPTPDQWRGYDDLDKRLVGPNTPTKRGAVKARKELLASWKNLERGLPTFSDKLARWLEKRRRSGGLTTMERGLLERIREAIEESGARAYFIVAPRENTDGFLPVLGLEEGVVEDVFNYSLPAQFPELFAKEARFDRGHLSRIGVRKMTRLLARDVARAEKKAVHASARHAREAGFDGSGGEGAEHFADD